MRAEFGVRARKHLSQTESPLEITKRVVPEAHIGSSLLVKQYWKDQHQTLMGAKGMKLPWVCTQQLYFCPTVKVQCRNQVGDAASQKHSKPSVRTGNTWFPCSVLTVHSQPMSQQVDFQSIGNGFFFFLIFMGSDWSSWATSAVLARASQMQ